MEAPEKVFRFQTWQKSADKIGLIVMKLYLTLDVFKKYICNNAIRSNQGAGTMIQFQ